MKTKFLLAACLAVIVAVPVHAQTASQKKRESYRRYNQRQAHMEVQFMQMQMMQMQAAAAERRAARAARPATPPRPSVYDMMRSPAPTFSPSSREPKPRPLPSDTYYRGPKGDVLPGNLVPEAYRNQYRSVGTLGRAF